MELGISTLIMCNPEKGYTDRSHDIYEALENLATLGYKFVEINTKALPRTILTRDADTTRMAEFLKTLNIKVHQIHISNNPGDIVNRDQRVRQEAIEWIKRSLDFCQVFKPKYVGIHPGADNEYTEDPGHWQAYEKDCLVESTRELASFACERGITLTLETIRLHAGKLNQIIDSLSDDDVGILVDVGHCSCFLKLDPADVIREAGSRLYSLHVHDNHGGKDEHLIPGEGTIRWDRVMAALKDVGYKGVFMLECHRSKVSDDPNKKARLAKDNTERLMARYWQD